METLKKQLNLWNMDELNSKLGVTTKFWWQPFFGGMFEGKKILDIGCGKGYLTPYWAIKNEVTGIDIKKESLDQLKERLEELKLKARLVKGDAEKVIFKEKFDIISINNMLHHSPSKDHKTDILKVLSNAKEMLKEGGHLLIVEPLYYFPFRWIVETRFLENINLIRKHFLKKIYGLDEFEYARTANAYLGYVKAAEFKIVYEKYDTNFFGYPLSIMGANRKLRRIVFEIDKIFTKLVPNSIKPFIYIIAKKKLKENFVH